MSLPSRYMGYEYHRGANVAYSLYGSKSGVGGCSKATFINSFYTLDGLYTFTQSTGISLSSIYSYSYFDNCGGDGNGADFSSALTCGDDKKNQNIFIRATFRDAYCQPAKYIATTDTLSALNTALDKQSCVKISTDTAMSLLSYSQTCTALSGSQCPDPHGILIDCEETRQQFNTFITMGDVKKPIRIMNGSLLFIMAFLIYGFAQMRKKKVVKESSKEKPLLEPARSRNLSISSLAVNFARTVSIGAQGVFDVVKEVLSDDDDDEEEENRKKSIVPVNKSSSHVRATMSQEYPVTGSSSSVLQTSQSYSMSSSMSYVPSNSSQEYVGETNTMVSYPSTDGEVSPIPSSDTYASTGLPPKSNKKKGILKKLVKTVRGR